MSVYTGERELYQIIASAIRMVSFGSENFRSEYEDLLEYIERNILPSGSGVDCGTKINMEKSKDNLIVLDVDFHHMDEHGYYDGWTHHKVKVCPDLVFGYDLKVTGRDKNMIKEYLGDLYHYVLSERYKRKYVANEFDESHLILQKVES